MHPFFPLRGPGLSPAEIFRDEEARVAALPPFPLPTPDRAALTAVALSVCRGRLWVPEFGTAEESGVPDDTWQGWDWPSGEWLLLNVMRYPKSEYQHFPITVPRPELFRVAVAGRPMRVRALGPGDTGWAGEGYVAEVTGFLDPRTRFWAQAVGATPERRAALLAAVCSLQLSAN